MKKTYYVAFSVRNSDNPFRVHAIFPPLELEHSEDSAVMEATVIKAIAQNQEIPEKEVDLHGFHEFG